MLCQNCLSSLDAQWLGPQTLSFSIDSSNKIRTEKICSDGLKSVQYNIDNDLMILIKESQDLIFESSLYKISFSKN